MKRFLKDALPILIAIAALVAFAVFDFFKCYAAAPVPMERLLRNGLTDAQVTAILATDPNATIHLNGSTWRNIAFNTARYNNVTNWLAVIGETNDFARLVVPLSQTNAVLTAENAALTRQVETLSAELSILRDHEIVFLQETATTLRSLAAKYPRMATELNAVIASINQRIEELGGEPVSTEGGAGDISEVD